MITFLLLLVILIILALIAAFGVGLSGIVAVIVFGDVFIAIALIVWIIKKIFFKN